MAYEDLILQCGDCGCDFEFTASEQEFYDQKGLTNKPKRCKPCRSAKKQFSRGGAPRKMYDIVCSQCGDDAQIPFKPHEDRPVLCKTCYAGGN